MPRVRGKPGPPCHVCKHARRAELELLIARGVAISAISNRFDVSVASLYRHARRPTCMPPQLKAKLVAGPSLDGIDLDKVREGEATSLLLSLINQRNRIFAAFDSAEEVGHIGSIVRVSSELRSIQELIAKLVGQLGTGTTVNNNLFVLPSYIELRTAITRALANHPEARTSVAAALHTLESKAAKDIAAETQVLMFAVPEGGPS